MGVNVDSENTSIRVPDASTGDAGVVLVVDDDPRFAETVRLWLDDHWDVILAHDGEEALDAYGPHVDTVLLDRRLPTHSGDEVLSEIRARDGDTGVAMMTAVEVDWDIVDMDFDMYLQKPVSRETVVDAVAELRERASYAREIRALFALSRKLGALQATYSTDELENDERYQRLEAEFERVQERTEAQVDDLEGEEFRRLLQVVDDAP